MHRRRQTTPLPSQFGHIVALTCKARNGNQLKCEKINVMNNELKKRITPRMQPSTVPSLRNVKRKIILMFKGFNRWSKNVSKCPFLHTRPIMKGSRKSIHSFICRWQTKYQKKIQCSRGSMEFPKNLSKWCFLFHAEPIKKFHDNNFMRFPILLLADKQTNNQTNIKENKTFYQC